jgi:molybdopterin-guanine dinucleotide biosynthesis protein MobB
MIVGIYGYQDSGKTTIVEDLVKALTKKGYKVSSIKHSPHRKSADCEGKDTWRHWVSGSDPVVFSSEAETTVFKHSKTPMEDIAAMLSSEYAPDVIVIEGFKGGEFPKVSVGDIKPRKGTALENPTLKELVSYIQKEVAVERIRKTLPGLYCHKCGLDCDALARAVVNQRRRVGDCRELPDAQVEVLVGGKKMQLGRFASSIVDETVRGMLSSLKGYEHGREVEIRLGAKRKASKRRSKAK